MDLLSCVPVPTCWTSVPERLPVFAVEPSPNKALERVLVMARRIFDMRPVHPEVPVARADLVHRRLNRVSRTGDRWTVSRGPRGVDVRVSTGAVWAADRSRLWNAETRPQLLQRPEAVEVASALVEATALFPEDDALITWDRGAAHVSHSQTRRQYLGKPHPEVTRLDSVVRFPLRLRLPGLAGQRVPLLGGGSKVRVALGDQGSVVGFSAMPRNVGPILGEFPLIPPEAAVQDLAKRFPDHVPGSIRVCFGYWMGSAGETLHVLQPVYQCSCRIVVDGREAMVRGSVKPATTYPPGGNGGGYGEPPAGREGREHNRASGPVPTGRQGAGPRVGTWWIGASGGLTFSQANAAGLVDELAAEGWTAPYERGETQADESDWRPLGTGAVDDVDLAFYTGHAGMNGWTLTAPNDAWIDATEVAAATSGKRWGSNTLRWAIIAACGPLQDESVNTGGGDAVERWGPAFDGMRMLLGYCAATLESPVEARAFAQYALETGTTSDPRATLKEAWFRAAVEVQPHQSGYDGEFGPDIHAAALGPAGGSDGGPLAKDVLPRGGESSPAAILAPTEFVFETTPC